jgi:hypothetical protein
MSSRISLYNFPVENCATQDNGTLILKRKSKDMQHEAIKNIASIPGTSTKVMIGDISKICLTHPTQMPYAISISSTLKKSLWRAMQKESPSPPLPESNPDLIKTEIPDNLSKTTDGE